MLRSNLAQFIDPTVAQRELAPPILTAPATQRSEVKAAPPAERQPRSTQLSNALRAVIGDGELDLDQICAGLEIPVDRKKVIDRLAQLAIWGDVERTGGHGNRYYKLTDKGRTKLAAAREAVET